MTGQNERSLVGHDNIVYCLSFNNPYGNRVATGSFDTTCKIWCSETGDCLQTLSKHEAEVVALSFEPQGYLLATGSLDNTAKIWDLESGIMLLDLRGHV